MVSWACGGPHASCLPLLRFLSKCCFDKLSLILTRNAFSGRLGGPCGLIIYFSHLFHLFLCILPLAPGTLPHIYLTVVPLIIFAQ